MTAPLLGSKSLLALRSRSITAATEMRANSGIQRDTHQIRWFASEGSNDDDQTTNNSDEDGGAPSDASISGSNQHDAWVQFQRSIAVSGVDTGQTVKERNLGKKNRGGKIDRKRKEREAELEAMLKGVDDTTQLKGGEFPALSYSEEETERLLAEAYSSMPPRAGKRGTNNLKRQERRWFIKRQYDYKKKREKIAAHEKRLAKRKVTAEAMKQAREEAPAVREREREYQDMVLQRWAVMNGHVKEEAVPEQKLIE
eukprot:CAMPEP_0201620692 /NCGR_PEP_ID=MMETSP0492-20130828/44788_1 /ASSEMBLY_ACC=CAM_ASM_000837 /TAXON_ID=420259 /ORGANISM="Thalassiosira gravida, Strain GMp14c1" /LENGTH=254 /DNA_ID=CAMNT_0048089961 /DNA_START=138 /DNA_END=902 /DNA_ORIENTATION=+